MPSTGRKKARRRRTGVEVALAGLAAVCCAIAVAALVIEAASRPPRETITITDAGWTRSVPIMEDRPVRQEGWELPEGARLVASEKRPYQYVRRQHQFRGTPVYADWYTYETDKPIPVDVRVAKGGADDERTWPQAEASDGQSVGEGTETLWVIDGQGRRREATEEAWEAMRTGIGQTYEVELGDDGRIESATAVAGSAKQAETTPTSDETQQDDTRKDETNG